MYKCKYEWPQVCVREDKIYVYNICGIVYFESVKLLLEMEALITLIRNPHPLQPHAVARKSPVDDTSHTLSPWCQRTPLGPQAYVIHEQAKDNIDISGIALGLVHSPDGVIFCVYVN